MDLWHSLFELSIMLSRQENLGGEPGSVLPINFGSILGPSDHSQHVKLARQFVRSLSLLSTANGSCF